MKHPWSIFWLIIFQNEETSNKDEIENESETKTQSLDATVVAVAAVDDNVVVFVVAVVDDDVVVVVVVQKGFICVAGMPSNYLPEIGAWLRHSCFKMIRSKTEIDGTVTK